MTAKSLPTLAPELRNLERGHEDLCPNTEPQTERQMEEHRDDQSSQRPHRGIRNSAQPLQASGQDVEERAQTLWPPSYRTYLLSDSWRATRERYRASKLPQGCWVCRVPNVDLHHRTYARLGNEKVIDLVPLCREHHDQLHEEGLDLWDGPSILCRREREARASEDLITEPLTASIAAVVRMGLQSPLPSLPRGMHGHNHCHKHPTRAGQPCLVHAGSAGRTPAASRRNATTYRPRTPTLSSAEGLNYSSHRPPNNRKLRELAAGVPPLLFGSVTAGKFFKNTVHRSSGAAHPPHVPSARHVPGTHALDRRTSPRLGGRRHGPLVPDLTRGGQDHCGGDVPAALCEGPVDADGFDCSAGPPRRLRQSPATGGQVTSSEPMEIEAALSQTSRRSFSK